jgi:hypothetical protein
MTNRTLSPAAQAVYDAFSRIGLYNEPSFETDRKALAAGLRAAADQVVPEELTEWQSYTNEAIRLNLMGVRSTILAIAAELEGVQ